MSAGAVPLAPSLDFEVTGPGGTPGVVNVPLTLNELTGTWGLLSDFVMMNPLEWRVEIFATTVLDPDPSIVYAASVIDFGAPSSFGFIFSQGIVPTPAPGIVSHTHSSSTSNGGGAANTPVTALAPLGGPVDGDAIPEIAVYTLSQDGGGSYLSAGLDLSPSFVGAAPSDTQGPFSEGPIAGPFGAGFYDFMRVEVNFSMDGSGDAYTFNGEAVVVPEPASAALLGLGLGLLALRRTRSRPASSF